jgi:predicted transcriptional regulator
MIITRSFSLTNFFIGTSALAFQVFVLYPWHEKLDKDFEQLKEEHLRVLKEGERARLEELKGVRRELEALKGKTGWLR